jgi:hypothetical protein
MALELDELELELAELELGALELELDELEPELELLEELAAVAVCIGKGLADLLSSLFLHSSKYSVFCLNCLAASILFKI